MSMVTGELIKSNDNNNNNNKQEKESKARSLAFCEGGRVNLRTSEKNQRCQVQRFFFFFFTRLPCVVLFSSCQQS